jgi:hypothetical protein
MVDERRRGLENSSHLTIDNVPIVESGSENRDLAVCEKEYC